MALATPTLKQWFSERLRPENDLTLTQKLRELADDPSPITQAFFWVDWNEPIAGGNDNVAQPTLFHALAHAHCWNALTEALRIRHHDTVDAPLKDKPPLLPLCHAPEAITAVCEYLRSPKQDTSFVGLSDLMLAYLRIDDGHSKSPLTQLFATLTHLKSHYPTIYDAIRSHTDADRKLLLQRWCQNDFVAASLFPLCLMNGYADDLVFIVRQACPRVADDYVDHVLQLQVRFLFSAQTPENLTPFPALTAYLASDTISEDRRDALQRLLDDAFGAEYTAGVLQMGLCGTLGKPFLSQRQQSRLLQFAETYVAKDRRESLRKSHPNEWRTFFGLAALERTRQQFQEVIDKLQASMTSSPPADQQKNKP